MKIQVIIWMLCLFSGAAMGQGNTKVLVSFADKDLSNYSPYTYLSSNAIERRLLENIPVMDPSDAPVTASYSKAVSVLSDSITVVTRWLNGVVAYTKNIEEIEGLSFVKSVSILPSSECSISGALVRPGGDSRITQLEAMHGQVFSEANIDGQGVRIAVFDVGFPKVDESPYLSHLFKDKRLIDTYDFVRNKPFVYGYGEHGLNTLGCIAGIGNGQQLGLATGAEILLARTERGYMETYSEEEFWLAAAEWADKNGAHIISSSLGYSSHRYFVSEMDGETSLVAQAAKMASDKGILVVNAMGNEGSDAWKYLSSPADVTEVLSVGGTHNETGAHVSFSSYGPTADGRMKPNVSADGIVITVSKKGLDQAMGTSFSTPLVSGFAACIKQQHPSYTRQELFDAIQESGALYPYYDFAHGYGIPQADKAEQPAERLVITKSDKKLDVKLTSSIEKNILYYKVVVAGKISDYVAIDMFKRNKLKLDFTYLDDGAEVHFHFRGVTEIVIL